MFLLILTGLNRDPNTGVYNPYEGLFENPNSCLQNFERNSCVWKEKTAGTAAASSEVDDSASSLTIAERIEDAVLELYKMSKKSQDEFLDPKEVDWIRTWATFCPNKSHTSSLKSTRLLNLLERFM